MGFPSPASDFIAPILTPNFICNITNSSQVIETSEGFAVVEPGKIAGQGDDVLLSFCGRLQFATIRGEAFICADGETIEVDACDEAIVIGVVTFTITDHRRSHLDAAPV